MKIAMMHDLYILTLVAVFIPATEPDIVETTHASCRYPHALPYICHRARAPRLKTAKVSEFIDALNDDTVNRY